MFQSDRQVSLRYQVGRAWLMVVALRGWPRTAELGGEVPLLNKPCLVPRNSWAIRVPALLPVFILIMCSFYKCLILRLF